MCSHSEELLILKARKPSAGIFLLLTVTHKNSIRFANNKECTLDEHTAKQLQWVFYSCSHRKYVYLFYQQIQDMC